MAETMESDLNRKKRTDLRSRRGYCNSRQTDQSPKFRLRRFIKSLFFILDEADRMLDMGFADDIMQIVKYLPKERQTIMFSATMPAKIQQLAKSILNNPVEVKLAVSKPAEKLFKQPISVMRHKN